MASYVGVCRIELELDDNDSLKGKRSVVKSIIQKARNSFNVAMNEVEDMDVHTRAVIGASFVGNDKRVLDGVIAKLQDFIERECDAPLGDFQYSIEQYD
jgi:uncharacterized protein YlxP (DUF503 family)